jgi:hypothetical protein
MFLLKMLGSRNGTESLRIDTPYSLIIPSSSWPALENSAQRLYPAGGLAPNPSIRSARDSLHECSGPAPIFRHRAVTSADRPRHFAVFATEIDGRVHSIFSSFSDIDG